MPRRPPLNTIVVGGGIGGLTATHAPAHPGHCVTLGESARELGDIGAGIRVSPNAMRLLLRWGLGPAWSVNDVKPTTIVYQ